MTVLEKAAAKMKKYRVPYRTECAFNELTTLGTGGKIYLTIVPENARQLVWAAKYLSRRQIPHCFVGIRQQHSCLRRLLRGGCRGDQGRQGVRFSRRHGDGAMRTFHLGAVLQIGKRRALRRRIFRLSAGDGRGSHRVQRRLLRAERAGRGKKASPLLEKGKLRRIEAKDCRFSKRNSLFKQSGCLVLQTEMVFGRDNPQRIQSRLSAMRRHKALTQPLGCRSAGCVLFHPTISLSPLIERAGLKGFRIGGAEVSQKHAGFIVNVDKASSADVYLLIRHVKKALCEMGVNAMTEVCLINFPPKEQQCPFPVR